MEAANLWSMFVETGAPEIYLMYVKARRMEDGNVPDDQGLGAASYGLQ